MFNIDPLSVRQHGVFDGGYMHTWSNKHVCSFHNQTHFICLVCNLTSVF